NAIDIENITMMIHEALINMNNIDENLEDNYKFYIEIAMHLSKLIDEILLEIVQDQYVQYLISKIVKLIEQ
ncbi:4525_t:CDS:1, partial [Cetraspora pellucida]